ncbi:MAG TPA: site-2 protease family protein [Anaerolineales bacterium]|nr:site-2 protease family protein [Anaerolineales bacterium]
MPKKLSFFTLFLYRMFYFIMLAFLLGITAQELIHISGIIGFFVFYLFVFLSCITVHESGHLLGAMLAKLHIALFSVGFLKFVRRKDRWHVSINKYMLLGGFTLAAPSDDNNLDRRLMVWTLGGPVMGLLYAVICGLLYAMISPVTGGADSVLTETGNKLLQTWLIANGGFSILITMHSIIPEQDWSATSDGYKVFQYWRKTPEAMAIKVQYLLNGAAQTGIRPRDWQTDYIEYLLDPSSPPNRRMQALVLRYFVELDYGEVELAGRSLDQALFLSKGERLPSAGLYWEAAYYTARYREQPQLARHWLQRAQPGFLDEYQSYARAKAAILLAEGNSHEAISWIDQGLVLIDHSLEPGTAKAEKDWLQDLRSLASIEAPDDASPQSQIKKLMAGLSQSGEDEPAIQSDLIMDRPIQKKKLTFPKLRSVEFVKTFIVLFIPSLMFVLVLSFLYYWLQPPECHVKILENFVCKSNYNLAVINGLNAERQGHLQKAAEAFSTALQADPEGSLARNMRAHLYTITGNYQQAFEDYSLLIAKEPGESTLYLARAKVLIQQEKYPLAIDDLVKAIELGGIDIRNEGIVLLESTFLQLTNFEGFSANGYEQWLIAPQSLESLCKLGLAYAYRGDFPKVEELLDAMEESQQVGFQWCQQQILEIITQP